MIRPSTLLLVVVALALGVIVAPNHNRVFDHSRQADGRQARSSIRGRAGLTIPLRIGPMFHHSSHRGVLRGRGFRRGCFRVVAWAIAWIRAWGGKDDA